MAFSLEKKGGFFFLVAMVIFGAMLEVGEKWNPFEKKVTYNTYLTSVTGLKLGDPSGLPALMWVKLPKLPYSMGRSGSISRCRPGPKSRPMRLLV